MREPTSTPPPPPHRIHLPTGRTDRVDRLLAEALPAFTRRRLQQMLAAGLVRIDGHRARKGDLLHGERWIEVELATPAELELPPEPEPAVGVLFEDSSCVVFDKPAGRPGHALRSGERGTVANFIAARFPECVGAGDRPLEAGLAHRLDTDTSGVLLAARSRAAWQALRRQFRERRVDKRYLAIVHGVLGDAGEIRRPIASVARSKVLVVAEGAGARRAQQAVTRYRPRSRTAQATLLDIVIPTGVRHQIRAHLAAIGHPVVGDTLYGSSFEWAGRQLLHAARIDFDHPVTAERISAESPLPDDFLAAMERLGLELRRAR